MIKYLFLFLISFELSATQYIINKVSELSRENSKVEFLSFSGTATAQTTTNIQYKLTTERWLDKAKIIVKDHCMGDTFHFQVVDVDNTMGLGANTVLDQFGTNIPVADDKQDQDWYESPYVAYIPANLYIRIAYTSTCATNVKVYPVLRTHRPRA